MRDAGSPSASSHPYAVDFDERPFTVAWSVTRACHLACTYCRVGAVGSPDLEELTPAESLRLIDDLASLRPSRLVLTGGDLLRRPDFFEIALRAVTSGLRVAASPGPTALLSISQLARLQAIGVQEIHVGLDGGSAAAHDAFRGVPGSFARVIEALSALQNLGMAVEVQTTLTRGNVDELSEIAALLEEYGVRVWNITFLVPTGQAQVRAMLDPVMAEHVWAWLCELTERAPFAVRTTAAPQFRRTIRIRATKLARGNGRTPRLEREFAAGADGIRTQGVSEGNGYLFIDDTGNVYPSEFLRLSAGNVRQKDISDIYRNARLFRELRTPSLLEGRCGACEFRGICGGSRARAYALSGSYLADDPLCARTTAPSIAARVDAERRTRLEGYRAGAIATDENAALLASWIAGYEAARDAISESL